MLKGSDGFQSMISDRCFIFQQLLIKIAKDRRGGSLRLLRFQETA